MDATLLAALALNGAAVLTGLDPPRRCRESPEAKRLFEEAARHDLKTRAGAAVALPLLKQSYAHSRCVWALALLGSVEKVLGHWDDAITHLGMALRSDDPWLDDEQQATFSDELAACKVEKRVAWRRPVARGFLVGGAAALGLGAVLAGVGTVATGSEGTYQHLGRTYYSGLSFLGLGGAALLFGGALWLWPKGSGDGGGEGRTDGGPGGPTEGEAASSSAALWLVPTGPGLALGGRF